MVILGKSQRISEEVGTRLSQLSRTTRVSVGTEIQCKQSRPRCANASLGIGVLRTHPLLPSIIVENSAANLKSLPGAFRKWLRQASKARQMRPCRRNAATHREREREGLTFILKASKNKNDPNLPSYSDVMIGPHREHFKFVLQFCLLCTVWNWRFLVNFN